MKISNLPFSGILFLFLFCCKPSVAQVCNKGPVIHFKTSDYSVLSTEKAKLDSLAEMIGKTDEAYIELAGHTDTKGKETYNMWLSEVRVKSVRTFINKAAGKKNYDVRIYNYGETRPLVNDTTDELRAMNRRVEVFFFPVKDNMIVMKDQNGASLLVNKDKVSLCGLCASINKSLVSKQQDIKGSFLTAEDDTKLILAGLVEVERACEQSDECADAVVRIPAEYDAEMTVWKRAGQSTKWEPATDKLTYDPARAEYVMDVELCDKLSLLVAKPASRIDIISVKVPSLLRYSQVKPYLLSEEAMEDMELTANNTEEVDEYIEEDASVMENINVLPVKNATDTSFTTECEDCRDIVMFNDTGSAENGYSYYFNGPLQPALQGTEKRTSSYTLTMEDYTPIVKFKDSMMVIKIPKKYANLVKVYLPGIDSSLNVRRYNKKENQYKTYIPAHPYKITFRESRMERYAVDDKQLCIKYKKRKNFFKAKIKKSYMKKEN